MPIRLLLSLLIIATGVSAIPAWAAAPKPQATTAAAENLAPTTAVVTGTVDPRGTPTTAHFQYGTSPAYGTKTPNQAVGGGDAKVPLSAPLTGLAPNTTYHYRIVAVSNAGTTRGADRVFQTTSLPPPIAPQPSKLQLARATISKSSRKIDILAPITARASGRVNIELHAASMRHRWTAAIDSADGRIRDVESIPAAQANLGTGILTIAYPGDPDTRPQVVRLRAANVQARLDASRPTLQGKRLRAQGTIAGAARGVVRVQLEYFSGGVTTTLEKHASITDGRWVLDTQITAAERQAIGQRQGTVHSYILFTGYLPAKMRGEMQSYQVLPAP